MATVQCPRCMVERKGFRRELDSWRHKLIHCVGFESILEGIYGPMLLRDLNVFDDCEPEVVDDWSPEASCSQCSFCNLPLDKLGDQVPAATSPLSSPSDYSPCQAGISESSQSAHRFLQAVFQKKEVLQGCDSNIPLVAQELMKKMIHRFAMDYASKCQLHSTTNSVTTRTSSPLSETLDAPLDLTVSRTQEDKEHVPEPVTDGVLDLSNRNTACSATSSSPSSSSSSSNHKASGTQLPPFTEELGDLGQRGIKSRQPSVLDTILSSLCPAHSSLLYQILKLVHQEKLLSSLFHKPPGQSESYCCSVHPQDNANPHAVALSECKALNSSSYYPLMACDNQGHGSTLYHPEDSKSSCCIHLCPSKDCNSEGSRGSGYCCVQRVKAFGCINKVMCSFASSPSLCTSPPSLCPPSLICCTQHTPYICPCYSNHARLIHVNDTIDRGVVEGDPPCPVLKREQSPSPPPLSPVPSDISKKFDEKPPSLLHHKQEEETDLMIKNGLVNASHLETHMDTVSEEKSQCRTRSCQAEQNPIGTSLQDVVNRFSEKLETIKPLEKDPPPVSTAVSVSEKEQVQFPSTSENFQFGADAHLTEIVTKLLNKGNSSDYNLDELVDRHDSKEPKSPNTRARRRQEALAAIATRNEDSSARRYTLKIKREFAMLDQSFSRRKVSPAKRAKLIDGNVTVTTLCTSSDLNIVKEESKREMEGGVKSVESHVVGQGPLSMFSAESDRDEVKDEIQTVIVTEDYEILKTEEKEREISHEEKELPLLSVPELQSRYGKYNSNSPSSQTQLMTMAATSRQRGRPCKKDNRSGKGKDGHRPLREVQKYLSNHSKEERRSRRNIVPPQRYSSYVTEPRKMFFVACFSDGIFNQRAQNDKDLAFSPLDPEGKDIQLESRSMSLHELSQKLASEDSEREQCGPSCTDSKTVAPDSSGQLSASPKRPVSNAASGKSKNSNRNFIRSADCVEKPVNLQVEYISPIKRMFVSPVKDKEGVRYSLKSAGSGSNSQADEHFDPCEVSSWSGTPEKHKSQSIQSPSKLKSISSLKSATSPAKSACSPTKSGCSPCKFASSPAKSASSTPKSASSPSKSASSPAKSASSPAKSASSTPKSASSPSKSASSPAKCASSTPKSVSSPAKSASSTPKSASSPSKAGSSVLKSASSPGKSTSPLSKSASSPKSASSSPKTGSRRSGEGAPPKRVAGTECRRSPCDFSFHESTPPKRRPGRPKKMGPQLEQKVKRPIGRPRKQKADDSVIGAKTVSGKSVSASDTEETVNKNLKITVVYGRSRRNKRMVSEGFDQLQTEFHDACQAVGLKSDLGILMHSSKTSSGGIETASTELSEEFTFVTPVKDSAPQSCSNIKCQKREDSVPSRKPGRPAKVKISGISVTVTTVSPRQRKIQINKETQQSPETLTHRQVPLPELKAAKEPWTISHLSTNKTEKGTETKDESKDNHPKQTVAVRHSMRVRKPSIHFLHAVATSSSRSYSHSNALLRRSKQLLLNKANNERRKEEQKGSVEASREKRQLLGHDKRKNISQDMRRVAGVSVDSIFTQKETLRWWAASAEEKTMNQELARRIRLISDTWVSDSMESQEKEIAFNSKLSTKGNYSFIRKSKPSSVVRSLFDCPPNKPRSCSMQQLCCWFMQTTETQSLAIVKKASSRNPYELRHFPRSTNKKSVCHSPQAERLRKHIKKFAKTVPKSPLQHRQAQERLRKRNKESFRRQLFAPSFATGRLHQGVQWWRNSTFRKYQATLLRARTRFLTQKEREEERRRRLRNKKNTEIATSSLNGHATGLQPYCKALSRSSKDQLSDCLENSRATSSVDQTQEPVDVTKEQNLCSKAWSPETLKECRVFLRKINSPDNESTEEEWDSCTVTLDDGSPSAYLFAGKERELVGVVKAVKTERTRSMNRTTSRELAGSAPKSVQEQDKMPVGRQKRKYKSPGAVSTEAPQPPPAKMLRQSRMRGLTGPRWCDFVFEN